MPEINPRFKLDGWLIACLLCMIMALAYLFWPAIADSRQTLWFTDGNLGMHRGEVGHIRSYSDFGHYWNRGGPMGRGSTGIIFNPNWPLLAALPMHITMWLNIAAYMLWAALGGWFCARSMGVGKRGAALSGVAYGLTTHFVSLMAAGHLWKLQCIPWIPWTFGFYYKAWQTGRVHHFLLAAVCYASAWLSREPQLPFYLGLYLGICTLWQALRNGITGVVRRPVLPKLALSMLCAVLAVAASWQALRFNLGLLKRIKPNLPTQETAAEIEPKQDTKAAYEFATGWSFPPEETAVFLTTGRLFGTKSPLYWGRTGTRTHKLKQVDDYMGILVIAFALFALPGIRKQSPIALLTFILFSSLIISFGRFTPVYRILYGLPTMASQRVPARWIAFTAFALCMLAGFGFEQFTQHALSSERPERRRAWILPIATAALALAMLIAWSALDLGREHFTRTAFGPSGSFSPSSDPAVMQERARQFISAIGGTGIWLIAAAAILACVPFLSSRLRGLSRSRSLAACGVACLLFIAADLSRNNKNYIYFFDWQAFFRPDPLITFFKKDPDFFRIQPIGSQHPYLNHFMRYRAGWHKIWLAETSTDLSRVDREFSRVFDRLSDPYDFRFSPRYYDLCSIKYVLSAMRLTQNITSSAKLDLIQKIPMGRVPPLYLYRYRGFTSDLAFVTKTQIAADEDAVLSLVTNPEFDINKIVTGVGIPNINSPLSGEVDEVETTRTSATFHTKSDGPGWILFKLRYQPAWHALINGKDAELYRVNALHCGIPLPPGEHRTKIEWRPPRYAMALTVATWIMLLVAASALALYSWNRMRRQGPFGPKV